MGETVSIAESQRDELNAATVINTKYQSIVILDFNTYILMILRVIEEGKEGSTPFTAIRTPDLWKAYDGVR